MEEMGFGRSLDCVSDQRGGRQRLIHGYIVNEHEDRRCTLWTQTWLFDAVL